MIGKKHDHPAHRWVTTTIKRTARRIMSTMKPWRTVNLVPLAGVWSNRYRRRDGLAITNDPCPGVLIQERGDETRTCFATYYRGLIFPAIETDGYEESTCAGGPRANPYRAGQPPWLLLDEVDPAQKVANEAAAVSNSFVVKNCDNSTT
jgi:hypothetical protein